MRLVAGVARQSAGMIGSHDLRKILRLCGIGFVAAGADDCRIKLWRDHIPGIVRVLSLRAMASLAGNDDVLALPLLLNHICVAGLANFVSGVRSGTSGDLGNGGSAIMSILTETLGHNRGSQQREGDQGERHDDREPNQVFQIFEHVYRAGACRIA